MSRKLQNNVLHGRTKTNLIYEEQSKIKSKKPVNDLGRKLILVIRERKTKRDNKIPNKTQSN